jgi:hypothetical protein
MSSVEVEYAGFILRTIKIRPGIHREAWGFIKHGWFYYHVDDVGIGSGYYSPWQRIQPVGSLGSLSFKNNVFNAAFVT